MDFQAPTLRWQYPDVRRYETLKNLSVIPATDDHPFPPNLIGRPPMLTDPHLLSGAWEAFYGPRLAAAASGQREAPFPARFPGHTLPAPMDGTKYVGALAIHRFKHMLGLLNVERIPGDLNGHSYAPLVRRLSANPWPWVIDRPELQQIRLEGALSTCGMKPLERERYFGWLEGQVTRRLEDVNVPVDDVFSVVRRAWGSTTAFEREPNDSRAGNWIVGMYRRQEKEIDWLALAFELEAVLSEIAMSRSFPVHGHGFFEGRWLEVARAPVKRIRSTELAVFDRVVAELFTLVERGFAPIIVNEFHLDTDGTHRLTAVAVWNILKVACGAGETFGEAFRKRVDAHLYRQTFADPVLLHEALTCLSQMLDRADLRAELSRLLPFISAARPVTYLPVMLLPEYSWVTVIKGPYDEGKGSIRVAPDLYRVMREQPNTVLPPRGPYHQTDRALAPCFQILEPT